VTTSLTGRLRGVDDDGPDAELSLTAWAVLGILSMNGELLTAGEIKQRSTFALRFFWGSPAVSHIRRELHRMLELGLVEEHEISLGGVRRAQAFQTTSQGEERLRRWVAEGSGEEAVVTRNPLLLRVFLGREIPVAAVLDIIDTRLRHVEDELLDALAGRRRGDEMGLTPHPDRRFSTAVSDYTLRQLYFDQGNLRQLRDTVAAYGEGFADQGRASSAFMFLRPRIEQDGSVTS
jgi:DNA-binding PadR family transcriptional regulator